MGESEESTGFVVILDQSISELVYVYLDPRESRTEEGGQGGPEGGNGVNVEERNLRKSHPRSSPLVATNAPTTKSSWAVSYWDICCGRLDSRGQYLSVELHIHAVLLWEVLAPTRPPAARLHRPARRTGGAKRGGKAERPVGGICSPGRPVTEERERREEKEEKEEREERGNGTRGGRGRGRTREEKGKRREPVGSAKERSRRSRTAMMETRREKDWQT